MKRKGAEEFMPEVERIADQLKRAFEGDAWHGPALRELLADVAAEKAAAKPLANLHSIWEIVLHVEAWASAVNRLLEGAPMPTKLSTAEDWPPVEDMSETAWQDTVTKLGSGHAQFREAIANLTDSDLQKTVAGQRYSIYFMLHGVIQHDLYHAGQIALLKKV